MVVDMEVNMVADVEVHMVADKVADMVADMNLSSGAPLIFQNKLYLEIIKKCNFFPSYDLFLRPMVFRIDEINICVFSFCCMGLVDIYCERKPNFRITKRLCVPNHHLPILLSIHEINFLQNMFFIYVSRLFNTYICKYANI